MTFLQIHTLIALNKREILKHFSSYNESVWVLAHENSTLMCVCAQETGSSNLDKQLYFW